MCNKVFLTGRVTREWEIRATSNGTTIARNSIAVDSGYGDNKRTDFINLTAFGKTAETLEKYGFKGQKLLIEGRIQTGSYEKDGVKHSTTDVIVDRSEFLSFKDNNASAEKTGSQEAISGFEALDDSEYCPF